MPGIDPEDGALAFSLTLGAGLCTAIGAVVVFNDKFVFLANKEFLASSLGFSAGVMLYVSFVEIFFKSVGGFADAGNAEGPANAFATISFFSGILLGNLLNLLTHWLGKLDNGGDVHGSECCDIDSLGNLQVELTKAKDRKTEIRDAGEPPLKDETNPEDKSNGNHNGNHVSKVDTDDESKEMVALQSIHCKEGDEEDQTRLVKMGMLTALAIAIHNFPEGLATFVATLGDPSVGVALALAIAIHNVPEGLCVAIPIFYATGNRWLAFKWAVLSGISEPIGAALGWAVLYSVMDDTVYGIIFGLVAGMMVNICVQELLPTAYKYDPVDKYASKSIICGMFVMALSLIIFTNDFS